MITRRIKTRRQLRSVRGSALSEEERRQELLEAEANGAHGHGRDEPADSAVSPRAAGDNGTPKQPEAGSGRAGVSEAD